MSNSSVAMIQPYDDYTIIGVPLGTCAIICVLLNGYQYWLDIRWRPSLTASMMNGPSNRPGSGELQRFFHKWGLIASICTTISIWTFVIDTRHAPAIISAIFYDQMTMSGLRCALTLVRLTISHELEVNMNINSTDPARGMLLSARVSWVVTAMGYSAIIIGTVLGSIYDGCVYLNVWTGFTIIFWSTILCTVHYYLQRLNRGVARKNAHLTSPSHVMATTHNTFVGTSSQMNHNRVADGLRKFRRFVALASLLALAALIAACYSFYSRMTTIGDPWWPTDEAPLGEMTSSAIHWPAHVQAVLTFTILTWFVWIKPHRSSTIHPSRRSVHGQEKKRVGTVSGESLVKPHHQQQPHGQAVLFSGSTGAAAVTGTGTGPNSEKRSSVVIDVGSPHQRGISLHIGSQHQQHSSSSAAAPYTNRVLPSTPSFDASTHQTNHAHVAGRVSPQPVPQSPMMVGSSPKTGGDSQPLLAQQRSPPSTSMIRRVVVTTPHGGIHNSHTNNGGANSNALLSPTIIAPSTAENTPTAATATTPGGTNTQYSSIGASPQLSSRAFSPSPHQDSPRALTTTMTAVSNTGMSGGIESSNNGSDDHAIMVISSSTAAAAAAAATTSMRSGASPLIA